MSRSTRKHIELDNDTDIQIKSPNGCKFHIEKSVEDDTISITVIHGTVIARPAYGNVIKIQADPES
tara:strand:- start:784 stop:981 length:198 start_codon:yes stop_codon:yes gene_type:complete